MMGQALYQAREAAAERSASIRSKGFLHIREGGTVSYGAQQVWYPGLIQRMSGCGPTAASNLLWYLAAIRGEACGGLFEQDGTIRSNMRLLMKEIWHYVTPGMRGVDKAAMLTDGAVRYGAERGVPLKARVLEIQASSARLMAERALDFLKAAFYDDLPVAFLNLSHGAVSNLESWHWVTLVATDDALRAEMYDQGWRQTVDLSLWLNTTKGGGAFAVLEPAGYETAVRLAQ